MTSSPPSVESADDRLKDLGLLYDAAFQNSDYEWQGKQFTEAYDRLHRFVEAQQTDTLSELRTQIARANPAPLPREASSQIFRILGIDHVGRPIVSWGQ